FRADALSEIGTCGRALLLDHVGVLPQLLMKFVRGSSRLNIKAAAPVSVPEVDPGGTTLFRRPTKFAGHDADRCAEGGRLERGKGIEPSYAAWEAAVLPLNYARALVPA